MKKVIACTLLVVSSIVGFARAASAEDVYQVTTDERGNTWQIDLDSRYTYTTSNGVRHVDFKLSTTNDKYWHTATASCEPYDIKSRYYGSIWSGTRSLPPSTVGGKVARAACY